MKRLLSVREPAELFGVSVACVRSWVLKRRIPFVKLEGAVRFDVCQLEKFINERRVAASK